MPSVYVDSTTFVHSPAGASAAAGHPIRIQMMEEEESESIDESLPSKWSLCVFILPFFAAEVFLFFLFYSYFRSDFCFLDFVPR